MKLLLALALALGCDHPTSDRVERIAQEAQNEHPALRRHFASMSADQAFTAGGDLAARGMPRLDDGELRDFMRRRAQLLGQSDAICAALMGGDAEIAARAFDDLSDDDVRGWFRLTARAQLLELEGGPRPLTRVEAETQTEEAVQRIRAALSAPDAASWDSARRSTAPRAACFVERTALRELLRMPDGVHLQRAMLEAALVR